MKTKEELKALREEVKALSAKLAELTEDELAEVTGGFDFVVPESDKNYDIHIYKNTDTKTPFPSPVIGQDMPK